MGIELTLPTQQKYFFGLSLTDAGLLYVNNWAAFCHIEKTMQLPSYPTPTPFLNQNQWLCNIGVLLDLGTSGQALPVGGRFPRYRPESQSQPIIIQSRKYKTAWVSDQELQSLCSWLHHSCRGIVGLAGGQSTLQRFCICCCWWYQGLDGTDPKLGPHVGFISWDILKNVKVGSKLRTNLRVRA